MAPHGQYEIGSDHSMTFFGWHPDRRRRENQKYKDVPNVALMGAHIFHPALNPLRNEKGDIYKERGDPCAGAVYFDLPEVRAVFAAWGKTGPLWQVHSLEIATFHIEPSIKCGCGDHGFVRNGRWEVA